MGETHGPCNAEGHGQHNKEGMGHAGHAGGEVVIQEIVHCVYEGHPRYEGQGTGYNGQEGGNGTGQVHGEIGGNGGRKGGGGDGDIAVELYAGTCIFHQSPYDGCQHGIKSLHLVAPENQAKGGRGQSDGQNCQPFRVDPIHAVPVDFMKLVYKYPIGFILIESFPAGLAGLKEGEHIHPMAVAFAEHGVSSLPVIHIDHNGGIGNVNLHILPVNAQISSGLQHIPHNPLAAGAAFHHHLPRIQDELHFISDREGIFIRIFQYKTSFVNLEAKGTIACISACKKDAAAPLGTLMNQCFLKVESASPGGRGKP